MGRDACVTAVPSTLQTTLTPVASPRKAQVKAAVVSVGSFARVVAVSFVESSAGLYIQLVFFFALYTIVSKNP